MDRGAWQAAVHGVARSDDCVCVLSLQLYLTLCDLMNCSPPGSSAVGFSRQGYWRSLPCPPPEDLCSPSQGNSHLLRLLHWQADSLPLALGFPVAQLVNNPPACRRPGFDPWVGKIPWRREWLPTPVFWPAEFHELCSPWGRKEPDTTERLSLTSLSLPLAPPGKPCGVRHDLPTEHEHELCPDFPLL